MARGNVIDTQDAIVDLWKISLDSMINCNAARIFSIGDKKLKVLQGEIFSDQATPTLIFSGLFYRLLERRLVKDQLFEAHI
jgi:hypothetical protein